METRAACLSNNTGRGFLFCFVLKSNFTFTKASISSRREQFIQNVVDSGKQNSIYYWGGGREIPGSYFLSCGEQASSSHLGLPTGPSLTHSLPPKSHGDLSNPCGLETVTGDEDPAPPLFLSLSAKLLSGDTQLSLLKILATWEQASMSRSLSGPTHILQYQFYQ